MATDIKFKGSIYGPEDPYKSFSVSISFKFDSLSFIKDSGEEYLAKYDDLEISNGGYENTQILISGKTDNNLALNCYINEEQKEVFLEHCKTFWQGSNRSKIYKIICDSASIKKKRFLVFVSFSLSILLIFCCCIAGCSGVANFISSKLPSEYDTYIGEIAVSSILNGTKQIDKGEIYDEVNRILQKVVSGIGNNPYNFKLYLADSETINAMAAPGGHVIVYTGLLKNVKSAEELAGILAHECGHVIKRHSVKQIVKKSFGAVIIYFLVSNGSATQKIAGWVQKFLEHSYSREDEREADKVGVNILVSAKINPKKFPEFFTRMNESKIAKLENALSIISTHPANNERITYLNEIFSSLPETNYEPLSPNWESIMKELK